MKQFAGFVILMCFIHIGIAQSLTFNAGGTAQKNYYAEIPYEIVKDKIIVPAVVNGQVRKFILDTGAPNLIFESLYRELHPYIIRKVNVGDANGKRDSLVMVDLPAISFGDISFNDVPTLVSKDTVMKACFGVDGLIGSNMLRGSIVQFASASKKIIITDDIKKLTVSSKNASKIVFPDRQSSPYITVKIGRSNEVLLFDTGSDDLYALCMDHFDIFKKADVIQIKATGYGSDTFSNAGLGNNTTLYRFIIPSLRINQSELKHVVSETTSDNKSRIGAPLLHYGIVTIDYPNGKFYFEPFHPSASAREINWTITPVVINQKLVVGSIWTDILRQQVQTGDQIIAIDGVTYETVNLCDILLNPILKDKTKAILTIKDQQGNVKQVEIVKE
ncbi:MAG TPA: aspartyl protease family protein [Ohtaekwangia sp.]|uniref:retropepsin-like aspartic protease n=1 Tax=Ohtaekwangia sp. TaxID=2066019 RepID=UPI002F93DA85